MHLRRQGIGQATVLEIHLAVPGLKALIGALEHARSGDCATSTTPTANQRERLPSLRKMRCECIEIVNQSSFCGKPKALIHESVLGRFGCTRPGGAAAIHFISILPHTVR
ncbi:MAG: hypothetical protein ACJ8F7_13850 [Gemmataceae bacterium]